jgi:hypothetical protein
MLLPDDIRDLAGRAINFRKMQVFEEFFLYFLDPKKRSWQDSWGFFSCVFLRNFSHERSFGGGCSSSCFFRFYRIFCRNSWGTGIPVFTPDSSGFLRIPVPAESFVGCRQPTNHYPACSPTSKLNVDLPSEALPSLLAAAAAAAAAVGMVMTMKTTTTINYLDMVAATAMATDGDDEDNDDNTGGSGGGDGGSGNGGCDGSGSGNGSVDKGNHNNQLKAVAATAMAMDGNDNDTGDNTYKTMI